MYGIYLSNKYKPTVKLESLTMKIGTMTVINTNKYGSRKGLAMDDEQNLYYANTSDRVVRRMNMKGTIKIINSIIVMGNFQKNRKYLNFEKISY